MVKIYFIPDPDRSERTIDMTESIQKILNKLIAYQSRFEEPPSGAYYNRVMAFYLDSFQLVYDQLTEREQNKLRDIKKAWGTYSFDQINSLRTLDYFSKKSWLENMFLHIIITHNEYMKDYDYNQFELFELFVEDLCRANVHESRIIRIINNHFYKEANLTRGVYVYRNTPDDWEFTYELCKYFRFTEDCEDEMIYFAFDVPYRYIGLKKYTDDEFNLAREILFLPSSLNVDDDYIKFKGKLESINRFEVWIEFV